MKRNVLLPVLALLLLAACKYDAPLVREQALPIQKDVLGLWEPMPEHGEKPKDEERMMILPFSKTEYLIHYPIGRNGVYYRGYPIKIGGIACVQLQILGTDKGTLKEGEKDRYQVVSYRRRGGKLEIKTLNADLVSDDLRTTEALTEAFLQHRRDKNLFANPGTFVKVGK